MVTRSIIRAGCGFGVALCCSVAALAQDLPPGVKAVVPSQLAFSESPRAPGILVAPLFGAPGKPEYYVFRAKYPPNMVNAPHHHPGDEELTVVSGTLYVGHGETLNRDRAIAYPPGSYLRIPAGSVHFLFTRDETAEVEVRGMGPRQNIFVK